MMSEQTSRDLIGILLNAAIIGGWGYLVWRFRNYGKSS